MVYDIRYPLTAQIPYNSATNVSKSPSFMSPEL